VDKEGKIINLHVFATSSLLSLNIFINYCSQTYLSPSIIARDYIYIHTKEKENYNYFILLFTLLYRRRESYGLWKAW
jgi:hypothetical protein